MLEGGGTFDLRIRHERNSNHQTFLDESHSPSHFATKRSRTVHLEESKVTKESLQRDDDIYSRGR